ncbi:RHS repeat-associated core domain-containing protein [Clostridium sp.]|uniref:RHS repeat-associated core domain-containing protein n=1 Tax=Clostridium sp. TaxID=1506 RepID=UPI002638294A|nr:RHS repeat-associated core domain-containing protein [Clostridium sp.]
MIETDKDFCVISRFTRGYEVVAADIVDLGENYEENLNRYYYTIDEQGSTAFITDRDQRVRNEYYYDAFGNVLESKEQVHNRLTYTGQQFDGVTGQYYLRARFYNPVIGRFIQEDIYRGDGLNLYAYCGNNPVRYYDPSGYAQKSCVNKSRSAAQSSSKDIQKFEVTNYEDFRNRSVKGDNLEGHELLQHAYLRDEYLAPNDLPKNRLSSDASKNNPVIALDKDLHKQVNQLQKENVPTSGVSGRVHIEGNIRVLEQLNVPEK